MRIIRYLRQRTIRRPIVPNTGYNQKSGHRRGITFTNDDSIREYVYVEDKVAAIESLVNDYDKRGSFNISTGWVFNQKDIVLNILENFDGLEPKYVEADVPDQIEQQSLSSIKWDWKPSWKFDDGIKATMEGFKKYSRNWN